jgi:hypothetical protein
MLPPVALPRESWEICYTLRFGAVPKWPKGEVCKTSIRGFESHPRLQASRFKSMDYNFRLFPGIPNGPRQEIPIHLEMARSVAPPLLLRGSVRHRFGQLWAGDAAASGERAYPVDRHEHIHKLPAGVTTVDATGRFAIPGLFEMHVHSSRANEEAFLAYGITSARHGWGTRAAQQFPGPRRVHQQSGAALFLFGRDF